MDYIGTPDMIEITAKLLAACFTLYSEAAGNEYKHNEDPFHEESLRRIKTIKKISKDRGLEFDVIIVLDSFYKEALLADGRNRIEECRELSK